MNKKIAKLIVFILMTLLLFAYFFSFSTDIFLFDNTYTIFTFIHNNCHIFYIVFFIISSFGVFIDVKYKLKKLINNKRRKK